MLGSVKDKIIQFPEDSMKKDFAKALNDSITLDTERKNPKPKSPKQLIDLYGINIEDQVDYRICLTKKEAINFLNKLGKKITTSRFNRRYTADFYRNFFKRDVSKLGKKALVFTYAEVQHMVRFGNQISFPKELEKYL